jgi:uncharacterized protein (DUF2345 family)
VAGANWGSNALPRVGQEVLVDFLEGNIDRPVIIGALYNGAGERDAQGNQVAQGAGAATGNAPAWFPGEAGAHAHQAVLSGLKSQTMASSQAGAGAYSQLVFDDSPGQPRVGLQRHAGAHLGTAELNLGTLRQQTDNQRLQPAGFGAELKTEHATALRAGAGLLLSTDARNNASGTQMDASEAHAQISASTELLKELADTAQKHNAGLKDEQGAAEAAPDKLPAVTEMAASATIIGTMAKANSSDGGGGSAPAFAKPIIQVSAPKGIVAATPASVVIQAGAGSAIVAGQDIDLAAQGNAIHAINSGISIFSYGKASAATKPNQETGIAMHAASGKVSSQSQSDETRLTADKAITVASVEKSVNVTAKQHVMLTSQGAFIKLEGGNISIHGPGTMTFRGSMKDLTGPASATAALPHLPVAGALAAAAAFSTRIDAAELFDDPAAAAGAPYVIERADGSILKGNLDQFGRTGRVFTEAAEELKVLVGDGEWEITEGYEYD